MEWRGHRLRAFFAVNPHRNRLGGARDALLAAAILLGIVLLTPRLRVYFQVTVVDVSVASVAADGTRTPLPTPAEFQKVGGGYSRGDTVVARLRPKIDAYMAAGRSSGRIADGSSYEWTIRWSDDSLNLDHVEQITAAGGIAMTAISAALQTPAVHESKSTLATRVERFLFAPANARTAAVMRIALAVFLPWAFWSVGLHVAPPAKSMPHATAVYEHALLTPAYWAMIVVVAALFGLGVRPRVTGVILFLMLLPLDSLSRGRQSRQVLLVALLAFSMLRSDACWSLATWRKRRPAEAIAGPMWPIRLIQIQLCLVYATNSIAKATPHYLSGETLIGMSLMRPNFLVDMHDGMARLGPIAVPAALAAIGSVVVESYLAVGFWFRKLRWITAAVGVGFHIALQSVVHIFMLDLASMFLYAAFLLPWTNERVDRRVARRPK